jgi:hypothetical protein
MSLETRPLNVVIAVLKFVCLSRSLIQLPVFNKKEEIFDNLCEKDVPVFRAVWYIKVK